MKDVRGVVAAIPVVGLNPESGQVGRAVALGVADAEQVRVVATALRIRIVGEHAQTIAEPAFERKLQAVVVAVRLRRHVSSSSPKVRERNIELRVCSWREHDGWNA